MKRDNLIKNNFYIYEYNNEILCGKFVRSTEKLFNYKVKKYIKKEIFYLKSFYRENKTVQLNIRINDPEMPNINVISHIGSKCGLPFIKRKFPEYFL